MQKDDHFAIAWLIKRVFDVVVEDVHFVTADRCEAETVAVGLESS